MLKEEKSKGFVRIIWANSKSPFIIINLNEFSGRNLSHALHNDNHHNINTKHNSQIGWRPANFLQRLKKYLDFGYWIWYRDRIDPDLLLPLLDEIVPKEKESLTRYGWGWPMNLILYHFVFQFFNLIKNSLRPEELRIEVSDLSFSINPILLCIIWCTCFEKFIIFFTTDPSLSCSSYYAAPHRTHSKAVAIAYPKLSYCLPSAA